MIHEAGHFLAARAVGMTPRKFYIGFGPPIVRTTRGGVEYGIGSIPLGGYVKIPGMSRPSPGDLFLDVEGDLAERGGDRAAPAREGDAVLGSGRRFERYAERHAPGILASLVGRVRRVRRCRSRQRAGHADSLEVRAPVDSIGAPPAT